MKECKSMRKTLSGPFEVRNLGAGAWHLVTGEDSGEIYLRGAGPLTPELLQDPTVTAVTLDWRDDGVKIAVTGAAGVRQLTARTAVVHEPRSQLYRSLPLAGFDADAKRFWRRVFRLIRVPGGRYLLRYIARRGAGKRAAAKH
jgi:hypothetical protein